MRATVENSEPLLALIRRVEARSDYGIVYGGIPASRRPKNLQSLTVQEVLDWQKSVAAAGAKSSAAGAYQIIRKTLSSLIVGGHVRMSEKFDREVQDRLGVALLNRRSFGKYLSGEATAASTMIALAKEWASFPVPADMRGASRDIKAGQSYYSGDGLNKALVSIAEVRAALHECKDIADDPAGALPPAPVKRHWLIALILAIFGGRK